MVYRGGLPKRLSWRREAGGGCLIGNWKGWGIVNLKHTINILIFNVDDRNEKKCYLNEKESFNSNLDRLSSQSFVIINYTHI